MEARVEAARLLRSIGIVASVALIFFVRSGVVRGSGVDVRTIYAREMRVWFANRVGKCEGRSRALVRGGFACDARRARFDP